MLENGTISLRVQKETEETSASFSICNDTVPFSSVFVYIETFLEAFKSLSFQTLLHLMPVTKMFECKLKAKEA